MINDYIDIKKNELIDSLIEIISIPSIAVEQPGPVPCGLPVKRALDYYVSLAQSMGFQAKNFGKYAEVRFGSTDKKAPKVYIACHVDVVPVGDGWTTDPFTCSIRDNKLYGRGVLDDKGPAIGVLYAIKAIKETGLVPKADIRIIAGGCEETSMNDLHEYVEKNGLPDYGLTPDSGFPIFNGECGISFGKFLIKNAEKGEKAKLIKLDAGKVFNCVPDLTTAELYISPDIQKEVKKILLQESLKADDIKFEFNGDILKITSFGVAAHGSVPDQGKNAAYRMVDVINNIFNFAATENSFIDFGIKWLVGDVRGQRVGIACEDEVSGPLSLNVGLVHYDSTEEESYYSYDIRVPVTASAEETIDKLVKFAESVSIKMDIGKVEKCTYMDPDCDFLRTLAACYEKITGEKATFNTSRGVTYAKSFGGRGVAFGPIDESDRNLGGNLHGIDEYIQIDALIKMTKIYANAIKDLWC